MEAMSKNHSQEVRSLMLKNKALSNEAEDLRNASQKLHAHLKVGRGGICRMHDYIVPEHKQ